jgi:hypothetical protein
MREIVQGMPPFTEERNMDLTVLPEEYVQERNCQNEFGSRE